MSCEEADVLVVGGGPVGLTMAAELSYRGIKTILIERRATTSKSARAVRLSSRSMEHFRRLGLEGKIQDASFPRYMPTSVTFSTGAYKGYTILKQEFSTWGDVADGVTDKEMMFFQPGSSASLPMFCPQYCSEAVILKHLRDTSETVTTFWGYRVTDVVQDDDGVTVKALKDDSEEEKTFRGRYLIGCDGGSSFVRKELGLHTYGHFVVAKACTITFRSPQLLEHMKTNNTTGFHFIVSHNLVFIMILLNNKGEYAMHMFLLSSTPEETVQEYPKNPDKWVKIAMGSSDIPFEVMDASRYNMHALVTTKFRVGRCFLAGDSAHQWLPAGGLGLNTGLSDVPDLSWKLEALLKGYGGKHLPGSYEIERRPLVDSTRRYALSLGNIALVASNPMVSLITSSSIIRKIVAFLIEKILTRGSVSDMDLVLGFQYSNSNLIVHEYNEDGSVRLHCNDPDKSTMATLPGCRAPHVVLPDSPTILDLFGKEFVILVIGGIEADLENLRNELTDRGVSFSISTYPSLPELVALYDRKYYLIRPDGVIAWRSDYQPSAAESGRIMSIVLGHVTSPRLPPPIMTYRPPQDPPSRSFVRDSIIRLCVTGILFKYSPIPLTSTSIYMVGFGVFVFLRALRTTPPFQDIQNTSRHQAAVVDKYGSANVLRIEPRYVGKFGPDDVLIRVHASSVNELDLEMREGLGGILNQKLSKLPVRDSYFPLILGRDCSGEVVAVGENVSKYLPGDAVFAAVPPYRQGAHAQLVAVKEQHVAFKPSNVDHKEAASFPWVAVTAWTALVSQAGVNRYNTRGKKILVHQGTSGVGSFAIQVLKSWGANVTTTCTSENTALAHHLGADKVVDDKTGNFSEVLSDYDIVLDTVGAFERPSLRTLKCCQGSVYVSLVSPYNKLVSSLGGLLGGIAFSWLYRYKIIVNRLFGGRGFYYSEADLEVAGGCLEEVRSMVESGAVQPLMEAVYSLDEIIDAHKHVESGQTRGKVVLSIH